jgi:hypothetical protein
MLGQPIFGPGFKLLKLHGSLSWYWVPGDQTGSTVQRWRLPGRFGRPEPTDEEERSRLLPGEPFVVPPASLKSDYLRNPVTREIWRRAYQALREAARVVLVGYSLPTADIAMSGMLAQARSAPLRVQEEEELFVVPEALGLCGPLKVEVVNPKAEEVMSKLRRLGLRVHEPVKGPADGGSCIQVWVNQECDRLASSVVELVKHLRTSNILTGEELVVVEGIGNRAVEAVVPDDPGKRVVVKLGQMGMSPRESLTTAELLANLERCERVVVEVDGRSLVVIDCERRDHGAWGSYGDLALTVAGKP